MASKCRVLVLVLLSALLFCVGTAFAQEHKSADKHSTQPQATAPKKAEGEDAKPAEHAAAGAPAQEGEHKVTGPGAQPAHASHEAAGEKEEDEAAEFKKAPSVLWFSKLLGLSPNSAWWLSVVLNFAVLAVVIFLALKKNLPVAFRSRTATIQKGMEEARKASEEANRRLADIESRLVKLDAEIGAIRAAAEQEAAVEEQRIQATAEEGKRKIVEGAEAEISAAAKMARRDLKAYAADLAVTLAEQRIRVDATTDQALVRSFVQQLNDPNARKDGK